MLGHKIAFLCVAKGLPRPQITWLKDGVEIYSHHYMNVRFCATAHFARRDKNAISMQQVHEWRIGEDQVKSKIEIDPATQMDAGVYECTADNIYSIDRRSFKTDFSIAFD